MRKLLLLGVAILLTLGLFAPSSIGAKEFTMKVSFTKVIGKHDGPALRQWAKLTCRGWTVEKLAEELGVEPTMAAVVDRLSRGLPEDTQSIVSQVCREELRKNE
jgi:hypothetical protein